MFNFFLGAAMVLIIVVGIGLFIAMFFGLSVHGGRIEELEKANRKLSDYWTRTDNHDAQIEDLQANNTRLWEVVNTNRNRVTKLEKLTDEEIDE